MSVRCKDECTLNAGVTLVSLRTNTGIVYTVSKLSRNRIPYVVMTVADLPAEDPHQLHWYLAHRVCSKFGWGTYYIARNHWWGESPGYKLVAKVRIAAEAIGLLKYNVSHPVFPAAIPARTAYWEKPGDPPRFIRIGPIRNSKKHPPNALSMVTRLAGASLPKRMKARGKGWQWRMAVLSRGMKKRSSYLPDLGD